MTYVSKLGPIPEDWFDNDCDPSIPVNTGPGSVYAKTMNELFQKLPEHVRHAQRRGTTTGIVGYRDPSDA